MAQVEIEKKFVLTETQKTALLDGSVELGEKSIVDSYLDTDDYQLTLRDYWFRIRDGEYELKAPLASGSGSYATTNRYREITSVEEICDELKLDYSGDIETTLSLAGIKSFITCYTTRQSYEKAGFEIDVDQATYQDSDFTYALAEIELLIEDESKADEAEARIIEFAQQFNLTTDQVILGKIAAYLKEEKPEHYQALKVAKVLK
ncbi:MAG: CYTH domain-containing protein [Candidatus Microsaccharimonas sp.]